MSYTDSGIFNTDLVISGIMAVILLPSMKGSVLDSFFVFGIHHSKAPIEIRERFSLSEGKMQSIYEDLPSDSEAFIISTCNRTEIWCNRCDYNKILEQYISLVEGDESEYEEFHFHYEGESAINHILEVCSGLDSQILGDLQIQSQIKQAGKFASRFKATGSELDRLLQLALRYSKIVKNNTNISEGAASVAYAAVQFLMDNDPNFNQSRILLFGTGKIGSVTCKNLRKYVGEKNIVLTNRTFEHAKTLAESIGAQVKAIEELDNELEAADVIIVATGASTYTVDTEKIQKLSSKNRILIDLSVPRNIDPRIAKLANCKLADVDYLSEMQANAIEKRRDSIPKAKEILEEAVLEFTEWIRLRHLSPTFKAIKNKLDDFRKEEIAQHRSKLKDEELELVNGLTDRMMNKLARQMINYLKENHQEANNPVDTLNSILELQKN